VQIVDDAFVDEEVGCCVRVCGGGRDIVCECASVSASDCVCLVCVCVCVCVREGV